ncbi:MAG: hypothetical protein VR73_01080 [Gammaproteobacteria bacterium BRH_c0]|nr:MAG: hypothetical protein VR73_01080 [Gammaproteobacteria bacterium BRH_c0]
MKRFENKVVMVAGGASGIGAATSEAFAREGAQVVVADIQDAAGHSLVEGLVGAGGRALYLHCDCTDAGQVEKTVAQVIADCGGLDVAANVLGGAHRDDVPGSTLHNTSDEAYDSTMAISLGSIFMLMKHQVSHMMTHGGGVIVNVSSMASLAAEKHATLAYGIAKAGLNHLTRFAAADYARYNIRVNAILPGITATPMLRNNFSEDEIIEMCAGQQAIVRPVEPYEQANTILWLASEEAAMITGVLLPVDGGRSAFGMQGPPASAVARDLIRA